MNSNFRLMFLSTKNIGVYVFFLFTSIIYSQDSLNNLENQDKIKHDFIYNKIIKSSSKGISPYDFIFMYKYRIGITYQNWNTDEIEKDAMFLLREYKKNNTYENTIIVLNMYWDLVLGISDYKLDDLDIKSIIEENRQLIFENLQTEISDKDIDLRISISNFNELDNLKFKSKQLFNDSLINKDRYELIKLKIIERKYNIKGNKKTAYDYYSYIIDNIDNKKFEDYIEIAMGIAVDFKFTYKLVEISNFLFKFLNEDFSNQPEINKYFFQIMAGYFYKYINRNDQALVLFLKARANDYHWDREMFTYEEITRDNKLIFEIFDIYINQNEIENAKYFLELYEDQYQDFVFLIKKNNNQTNKPKINKETFIEVQRKMLDMKRRLLFKENKHEESEKVIDKMLDLEKYSSYYGIYNLQSLKFASIVSQNKFKNKELIQMLDSIYLNNGKNYDKMYYSYKKDFGIIEPEYFGYALEDFKSNLSKLELINKLSYENQIYLLVSLGIKMKNLERNILLPNVSLDNSILDDLVNYKLKVDDLDRYNTRLLNLDEIDTDIYFKLLNQRVSVKGYENSQLIINEFNLFQQNKKLSFIENDLIEIKSFQKKLNSNQAYIRFSKLKDIGFSAYVISKTKIDYINISELDLNRASNYYNSRIINKDKDTLSYELLFKPIVDSLSKEVNELFVKNEGEFNNINIESLWDKEKQKYLFDLYKISYIERPSAIFKLNEIINFNSAFLFGNPDFSQIIQNSTSKLRSGINPLPYTEKEINSLNKILNENNIKTVTTNLDTSTEKSLYDNSKSSIIHLATHGFYIKDDKNNRFNWGLLASGSKKVIQNDFKKEYRNDGVIFGAEIQIKDFTRTELVVLSACETGYGTTTFFGGENLANSFLRAGAKNIISTLWAVDDEVTQIFMRAFYLELSKNKNINLSLRKAKKIIKQEYKHPNYWAPFVLIQNKI